MMVSATFRKRNAAPACRRDSRDEPVQHIVFFARKPNLQGLFQAGLRRFSSNLALFCR
jgi:hypothetical protein